jgi:hypothetical protein
MRRKTVSALILLATFILLDCGPTIVASLYPVYTNDNLIYLPELEGTWKLEEKDHTLVVEFKKSRRKSYVMQYRVINSNSVVLVEAPFSAHLAQIGEKTFLNIHAEKGSQRKSLLTKLNLNLLEEDNSGWVDQNYGIGVRTELADIEAGTPIIWFLHKGSPAFNGGLKVGDRIVGIDGQSTEVVTKEAFEQYSKGPRGSPVTYKVTRKGEPEPLTCTLTRDYIYPSRLGTENTINEYHAGILFYIQDTALTVTEVQQGSSAVRAGIKQGDKIVRVNGQPVKWMVGWAATENLKGPEGSEVAIEVEREYEVKSRIYKLNRETPLLSGSTSSAYTPTTILESLISRSGPYPEMHQRFWLGSHIFLNVSLEQNRIILKPLSFAGLSMLLREKPDALEHVDLGEEWLVLTADPEKMHHFLLDHGSRYELFPDSPKFIFYR